MKLQQVFPVNHRSLRLAFNAHHSTLNTSSMTLSSPDCRQEASLLWLDVTMWCSAFSSVQVLQQMSDMTWRWLLCSFRMSSWISTEFFWKIVSFLWTSWTHSWGKTFPKLLSANVWLDTQSSFAWNLSCRPLDESRYGIRKQLWPFFKEKTEFWIFSAHCQSGNVQELNVQFT